MSGDKKPPMSGAAFIGWIVLGVVVVTVLAFCCGYNTP